MQHKIHLFNSIFSWLQIRLNKMSNKKVSNSKISFLEPNLITWTNSLSSSTWIQSFSFVFQNQTDATELAINQQVETSLVESIQI